MRSTSRKTSPYAGRGIPELKPCPFCASGALYLAGLGVQCVGCGAVAPGSWDAAARRWNQRAVSMAASVIFDLTWISGAVLGIVAVPVYIWSETENASASLASSALSLFLMWVIWRAFRRAWAEVKKEERLRKPDLREALFYSKKTGGGK